MKVTVYENGVVAVEPSEYPAREKDEVVVEVKACGVCGSDIPRVYGKKSYYYPIVLGHEFSGIVKESENEKWKGKRVGVFPILPCKKCVYCQREQYANCTHYGYYGSRTNGGMQEYLAVKEDNLIALPENVSYEAGAMLEPTAVCLHAVKKARIQKGERVVIFGAGTIGMLCAMWAKDFGAEEVFFVEIDEQKLSMAESLGFKRYQNEQVEVAIEASGASACINQAIEALQPFGRLVLVGNASGDMTIGKENYSKLLRRQLSLFGSWNSYFSKAENDWQESVQAIEEKRINPEVLITHKVAMGKGEKAFEIAKNREFYNKIMVIK
jgi:L-iditol 2-dehydrogenase